MGKFPNRKSMLSKTTAWKQAELNLLKSTDFYMYPKYFDFFHHINSYLSLLTVHWYVRFSWHQQLSILSVLWFWQLSTADLHYLTRVHYLAENAPDPGTWGEHEIDYILIAQKDVDVTPNLNEVESYTYVSQEQLRKMIGKLFTLFIS